MVMAVVWSSLRRDCWIGEAPRYAGSLDIWMLRQAVRGFVRTGSVKIMPKAMTMKKSDWRFFVIASSSFLFCGWKIGRWWEVARVLIGEGVRICLRPKGRSGWVNTASISMFGSAIRLWRAGRAISGVAKNVIFILVL